MTFQIDIRRDWWKLSLAIVGLAVASYWTGYAVGYFLG